MRPKNEEVDLLNKMLLREYGSIDIYLLIQEPASLKEMPKKQLNLEKYQ
jgi:hypothetical protein